MLLLLLISDTNNNTKVTIMICLIVEEAALGIQVPELPAQDWRDFRARLVQGSDVRVLPFPIAVAPTKNLRRISFKAWIYPVYLDPKSM